MRIVCSHRTQTNPDTLELPLRALSLRSHGTDTDAAHTMNPSSCPNIVAAEFVKPTFETLATRDYVGQQQSWHYVSGILEAYAGGAPRATCADWTLHFTGPSGSGKSFLAELIANAAFEPWEEEAYAFSQYGIPSGGGAVGGALGWMVAGPVGVALGASVGSMGASKAWRAAVAVSETLSRGFRAPRPFPSQCGVMQHKFSRGSTSAEVRAWEYRVAAELRRDPASVIVVDDIGRLRDAEAFELFGQLLCGVGGNSIPEFRTGAGDDAALVPASEALFILTSDLEIDPLEVSVSCETDEWEPMLDAVRHQSARFWHERQLPTPDWWEQISLVPFRELCADELADVTRKYLGRQLELAGQHVAAWMQRRCSWALSAQRVYRWTGTVKHGAHSLAALDAYVAEAVASSKLVGGRQGGWVVADFHRSVMKPALQALTSDSAAEYGVTALVSKGQRRVETTWLNYTTLTFTSELCLEIVARDDAPGSMPRVRFSLMRHLCL